MNKEEIQKYFRERYKKVKDEFRGTMSSQDISFVDGFYDKVMTEFGKEIVGEEEKKKVHIDSYAGIEQEARNGFRKEIIDKINQLGYGQ